MYGTLKVSISFLPSILRGRRGLPCLIDPNTGREVFESVASMNYLERTYA